jgi:regulator of RNase E activity RraA
MAQIEWERDDQLSKMMKAMLYTPVVGDILDDLGFADLDGVVVIPQKVEAEVIQRSLEKARGEKLVRKEIEAGISSTEAFRKYGIL